MNGKSPRQSHVDQAMQSMAGVMNGHPAMVAMEAWMSFNRPMIAAVSELQGRVVNQVARANTELLGFMNRRFNEDVATSQRLLECRSMEDIFAAYSEYVQKAQEQYRAEFQEFARMNQKLAEETASVMRSRLEEAQSSAKEELRH